MASATKLPELVGRKEAAKILGVAQQNLGRVKELPEPAQRLSTGPVWVKANVERVARERKAKRG